jgi:uncharacterized membrane protein
VQNGCISNDFWKRTALHCIIFDKLWRRVLIGVFVGVFVGVSVGVFACAFLGVFIGVCLLVCFIAKKIPRFHHLRPEYSTSERSSLVRGIQIAVASLLALRMSLRTAFKPPSSLQCVFDPKQAHQSYQAHKLSSNRSNAI